MSAIKNDIINGKLESLPSLPGVYIMKNKFSQIIYVGKAKNLRNRVNQYFDSREKASKVKKMVENIYDFDYIITRNNVEALILENNLIKENSPPYNVLLKDDKTYAYVRLDLTKSYPTVEKSRGIKVDGAKYYGPYMQNINVNSVLDIIYTIFHIRNCNLNLENNKKHARPCVYHFMGKCDAPCVYNCIEKYASNVQKTIEFLSGDISYAEKTLRKIIQEFSDKLDFENALKYKNMLDNLKSIKINQVVDLADGIDQDVIAIVEKNNLRVLSVLFVRSGHMVGKDVMILGDYNERVEDTLMSALTMFYSTNRSIPTNIVLNTKLDNTEEFVEYIQKKLNIIPKIVYPIKGLKKELINIAEINAKEFLEKQYNNEINNYQKTLGALELLKNELKMRVFPRRIECFDISHISGTNKVGSMVVSINGKLDKKLYRRFRIKTVQGNNDYESIKEVIQRRFMSYLDNDQGFNEKPDLVVIDGGFGQLKYANEVLENLSIKDVEIISLAERDELICTLHQNEYIKLGKNNPALRILISVRDEAHRFAISYHRRLRNNAMIDNSLINIPGIGPKKVEILIAEFKTMENIKKATFDELVKIDKITKKDAENICEYFLKY